jgi:hypothetical protein
MQTLKSVVTGLCSMALVLTPVAAPLAAAVAAEPWEIVPEDSLRDLRGGMDMGDLVASFAIERVVQIDGVVVARMQLVISNLDRLAKGGMPTISVTGPMAEIVQFMKTAGNISVAGSNTGFPSTPAAPPAAAGGTAASGAASMGSTASTAISHAAASTSTAAATGSSSTAGSLANTANSAGNAATAASNMHLQASAPAPQPASTSAAGTSMTVPVGTTGQAVVLNNLPNAAALSTAIQNEVHAATIQTQTTISATVNSLPALNAISLSNSIRAQVSGGG